MKLPLNPREEDLYKIAVKRIDIKRNYVVSLLTYLAVNGILMGLSFLAKGEIKDWILILAGAWGIKIALDTGRTYTTLRLTLNQKAIHKEMDRIKHQDSKLK